MDERPICKIIHIDMDALYASVEQRDDPALRGRPVAVGYPAKCGVALGNPGGSRKSGTRALSSRRTFYRSSFKCGLKASSAEGVGCAMSARSPDHSANASLPTSRPSQVQTTRPG